MKKVYVILSIVLMVILGLLLLKYLIVGKKLEISFVTAQKHTQKDLAYDGFLNNFDWMIINNEEQRKNIEEEGYIIPSIDFNKNFLIMSRYKISLLYRKKYRNHCTGVPDGIIFFNKINSDKDFYYFYLMPRVMLSQGVG